MKTPINFLKAFLVLFVFSLIFFSCAKEEVLPVTSANQESTSDPAATDTLPDMALDEALASLEFAEHPNLRVAIKTFRCRQQGTTLVVHNPSEPDLRYFDSRRFKVYWFKDGQPVRSRSIQLDCVCKGDYAAIVMHTTTQQAVGIAYYNARACFTIENSVNSGSDS